nr:photosynthetic complex assembly protein PuhC [uncultured Rhodopila sp.]
MSLSHEHHREDVPRPALIAIGCVVALSIAAAAVGRLTGATETTITAAPVLSRDLLFQDRPNGAIAVFDAKDPATPIAIVPPETNGFLRGTMRGLAQQRIRQDADLGIPFRLTEWADSRLTLEDLATHRMLDLEAFGATNEGAFLKLITAKAGS